MAAHPLPRAPLHPDRRRAAPARPRVRSAAGSSRRSSPAASSTTPTAPRPASPPSPPTPTSRPPASRPTTTAHKFHFLAVTHDAGLGRVLTILSCPGDWPDGRLSLPARTRRSRSPTAPSTSPSRSPAPPSSSSAAPAASGQPAGPELDASVISDEGGRGEHGSFTGAFVGMLAFDTSGRAAPGRLRHASPTVRG